MQLLQRGNRYHNRVIFEVSPTRFQMGLRRHHKSGAHRRLRRTHIRRQDSLWLEEHTLARYPAQRNRAMASARKSSCQMPQRPATIANAWKLKRKFLLHLEDIRCGIHRI